MNPHTGAAKFPLPVSPPLAAEPPLFLNSGQGYDCLSPNLLRALSAKVAKLFSFLSCELSKFVIISKKSEKCQINFVVFLSTRSITLVTKVCMKFYIVCSSLIFYK
jgi:hypothetical protein